MVIPTRNRPESLARALRSIAAQDRPPDEVIVVDASDAPPKEAAAPADLEVVSVSVPPHLCRQRNHGVRMSRGSHVLLCDDDVELPPDYLRRLIAHLDAHPSDGAVTGVFRNRTPAGDFAEGFPAPSVRGLAIAFVFQLSVWGDVERLEGGRLLTPALSVMKRWYHRRGNTWSLAGWPLVTQVRSSVVRTAVYSLGAALVRREWLLSSPYDERLGTHGIGDNYGVALGFPVCPGVSVRTDLDVLHHRAPESRMTAEDAHFERVLALDYFTRCSPRFPWHTSAFLIWSLLGNAALSLARGRAQLAARTLAVIGRIATGRHPLLRRGPTPVAGARIP